MFVYINRYLDDCQCAGFCSQICMDFFFTVCECVLGEKLAMSSPRALVCVVCIVSSLLNFICSCLFVCYLTNFTYILKAYG